MYNYDDCRRYVDHLVAEHRRLHRTLVLGRKMITGDSESNRDVWTQNVVKVLRDVRDELQCHFAEEEGGGCLDEAVSYRPQLAPEMKRIEAQHPGLLAELDQLIAHAADYKGTAPHRVAIERGFDELRRKLHAHEAAEIEVVRQGFRANIEADSDGLANLASDV